ncbi:DUF3021 domain-containing protein [Levilactobacillus tongjiangensis]|uniref:DUF3021 domain-containing protein n=1 Tax=Levilactobacillus tongjiangensis TaxID=2486023 RepID=A0ABW1SRR7_9LACO|nr:DUF3021 domain-containing protein [Levilactobacillus tongjiangensis]
MKKGLRYGLQGMGYGAVTYLLLIVFQVAPAHVSPGNGVSLLLTSALIGVLSLIFDNCQVEVSLLLAFGVHLVGTALLMVALMAYNDWPIGWTFWLVFLLIYLVISGTVRLNQHLRVTQINRVLKKRPHK